jgi:hypothetical protein
MSEDNSDKMSIKDAIRLKHELHQDIRYSGYNAKEIQEMENLTKDQYADLKRQLSEIEKSWWFFPDYVWFTGIVVAGFCIWYFPLRIVHLACLIVIGYCIANLAYRAGVSYGYERGYEGGHEEGVHKALGISDDDAHEISEIATEMEIDENIIKKMDERNK